MFYLQNDENKHAVQFDMEGIMAMLWREMQQTLHDHNKATEDKVIATEHLRINDEQSLKEINAHKKQILKLQVGEFLRSSSKRLNRLMFLMQMICVCAGLDHSSALSTELKSN